MNLEAGDTNIQPTASSKFCVSIYFSKLCTKTEQFLLLLITFLQFIIDSKKKIFGISIILSTNISGQLSEIISYHFHFSHIC